ncbi:hypothetical protein [Pelagibacterium luteolum]|uniref:PilZ domain-containing protein n=1 Tax=Pelagibacterium luteolum TaxID=440168 RepID=A0A1G7XXQ4_9HYPH|nr:hypothetical protein [Pelagibacterium luteolum]SDG88965.1 hypothetical protein SAMN04487974_11168 [Pelagibacterium luteolum]
MDTLIERRTGFRELPVLRGPAIIVVGAESVEAFIENTSTVGLMITVSAKAVVPPSFTLCIGEYRKEYELVWRNGTHLGARLSS